MWNLKNVFFFFNIYLFIRNTERVRQRHRQREKQPPWGEPNVGLDPRTPGSRPELRADAQLLSHPGTPTILKMFCVPKYSLKQQFSKYSLETPESNIKPLQEELQTVFVTKLSYYFLSSLTPMLSQPHSGALRRLQGVWRHNRPNAPRGRRMQLIKPSI